MLDLVGARVTVAGRPGLEDVGDEDLVARDARLREQLVEEAPGGPDERPADAVLARPGRLADDDDRGVGATLAGTGRVHVSHGSNPQPRCARISAAIASRRWALSSLTPAPSHPARRYNVRMPPEVHVRTAVA